jgi:DNA-binding FadR family transcriptional regulator
MPDVLAMSGRDRRRIRKMVDAYCAARDARERAYRFIRYLFMFHEHGK